MSEYKLSHLQELEAESIHIIREVAAEPFFCEDYGVRVWEDGGEDASVPGITVSAQRVDELLSLLVEHRVSPAALADVVADWL